MESITIIFSVFTGTLTTMASSLRPTALYTKMSNCVTIVTQCNQKTDGLTESELVVAGQTLMLRYSQVDSSNGVAPDLTDISPTALPTSCYTVSSRTI